MHLGTLYIRAFMYSVHAVCCIYAYCASVHLGKKNLDPQGDIILHNEAIQRVTKAKFLGVIVQQHLNWKDHISMVS